MKKFKSKIRFLIKSRKNYFVQAINELHLGLEESIKAFCNYIESLSEEEGQLIIASDNYNIIWMCMQKKLFSNSCKLKILQKLIDKNDHDNIMVYLPQINFNQELSQKLISRGNHDEIMMAIKNACFTNPGGKDINGFIEVLERGNHDEIMAFLNYPEGIRLRKNASEMLVARGNHDEIILAIKNACFNDASGTGINGFIEVLERENHDEIMAFLNYPGGIRLTKTASEKLVARGNHEEIMLAIKNACFNDASGKDINGFIAVLERGNHDAVMAFLNYPGGICLTRTASEMLVARGNHDEIMMAIKNACFSASDGESIHGFIEVLKRGNHDEIMAFLNYPEGIRLTKTASEMLLARGNHEEIMLAKKNNSLFRIKERIDPEEKRSVYADLDWHDWPYSSPLY